MKTDKETNEKLYTYNEVVQMLRKHKDNHKIKFPLGTREYDIVRRFYEPLQDDLINLYLGKPLIEFDDRGYQIRNEETK